MTKFTQEDYQDIAARCGVDLDAVRPQSLEQRLDILATVLEDESLPYPIPVSQRADYFEAAKRNEPFKIGEFGTASVDLREYANVQHYSDYTFEEHLSWACLVAQQSVTKQRYACREYLVGEELFEIGGGVIPDYYILNARIFQQTNWQLATVTEIIPAELFFTCHSQR